MLVPIISTIRIFRIMGPNRALPAACRRIDAISICLPSMAGNRATAMAHGTGRLEHGCYWLALLTASTWMVAARRLWWCRSEEHTSELQSRLHLVCRLLLEKKKKMDVERDLPVTVPY